MLPPEVVTASAALLKDSGNGIGVAELSHRSKEYMAIHQGCISQLRSLLQIPDTHEILLVPGGATTQFALVPMNLLDGLGHAAYFITGSWSSKAAEHAEKVVEPKRIQRFNCLKECPDGMPTASFIDQKLEPNPDIYDYLHVTSNNTIRGTQYREWDHNSPVGRGIDVVVDASSDILSRPIDWRNHGCLYAGAQKNLGIAGVAVVIIAKKWLNVRSERVGDLPPMLSYKIHADKESMYNTPPTFPITVMKLMLDWVEANGGVSQMAQNAEKRAHMLSCAVAERADFKLVVREAKHRSRMNITFTLRDGEKTEKFLNDAKEEGLVGLKGHRNVGGIRASMYNAMPLKGAERLADFISRWNSN